MEPNGGKQEFHYQKDAASGQPAPPAPKAPANQPTPLIQWRASEFIDHHKSSAWIMPLILGAVVVSGGIFLLTRDILATVVILLGSVAFGIYAYQKPRTLTYTLLPTSLKVGDKSYSYDDFRAFSIVQEGGLVSILLQPIRRFMPPLTIYFDPNDGEKIFDTLAAHLPHQERQPDPVDRLMRKIRF